MRDGLTAVLVPSSNDYRWTMRKSRWESLWRQRLAVTLLVLSDVLFALLVYAGALAFQLGWGRGTLSDAAWASVIPTVGVWVMLRVLFGLYPGYGLSAVEELRRQTYTTLAAVAVIAVFALGLQVGEHLSRLLLVVLFVGLLFLTPLARGLTKLALRRLGIWGKPVVILSYKETGTNVATLLEQEWQLGYNPIAVFNYRLLDAAEGSTGRTDQRRALDDIVLLSRDRGVDTLIFAMPYTRREQLAELVDKARAGFPNVLIIPNLSGITNASVVARDLAGIFAVEIKHNLLDPWTRRVKRTLDLLGAVMGGLLISPVLLSIALLIRLDSPGPVFYGHRRLGADDREFLCWKFRTMHLDAERLLNEYLQATPALQAEWEQNHKLKDDPRITRIGRLLRKMSLDELPQLWNVLRGEMSLTGPRPIVEAEVSKYGRAYDLYYSRIRPGMSGLWQVVGRSGTSYDERVALDAYYVHNWSVWLDLVILARTVKTVVFGRGAY